VRSHSTNEALRILQQVGVRDGEFLDRRDPAGPVPLAAVGRFARIGTAGIIDGHPMLVTFYQPELEQLLRAKLASHPSIDVRLGVALDGFADDGRPGAGA